MSLSESSDLSGQVIYGGILDKNTALHSCSLRSISFLGSAAEQTRMSTGRSRPILILPRRNGAFSWSLMDFLCLNLSPAFQKKQRPNLRRTDFLSTPPGPVATK